MAEPTPGALNINGYVGLVEPPQFSVEHGFYNAPFQLDDHHRDAGCADLLHDRRLGAHRPRTARSTPARSRSTARARSAPRCFATAGSRPTRSPARISSSTTSCGRTTRPLINAGFPASWGGVAADYGMDPDVIGNFNASGNPIGGDLLRRHLRGHDQERSLAIPTMSIVMDMDDMFGPNGIYTNSTLEGVGWERASIRRADQPGRQHRFSDRGRHRNPRRRVSSATISAASIPSASSSRANTKATPSSNSRLFGADAADVVRHDRAADGLERRLRLECRRRRGTVRPRRMGPPLAGRARSTCRRTARACISTSTASTGAFTTRRSGPTPPSSTEYYGGEKHEWDATNSGDPVDGDMTAWNTLVSLSQAVSSAATEARKTAAYMRVLGLNPDGTDNPSFEAYLDAVNYVDYLMVNFYGGNVDWPHRNWYTVAAARPRKPGLRVSQLGLRDGARSGRIERQHEQHGRHRRRGAAVQPFENQPGISRAVRRPRAPRVFQQRPAYHRQ